MHAIDIGLTGFILVALCASLAVKQVAHVLVYGSVFDWIRNGLKNGIEAKVPGAKTLHALFTCTLCMITQVSIWFVAIPVAVLAYHYGATLPLFAETGVWQVAYATFAGIMSALVVGAFATYWMFQVEYPTKRYQDLYEDHRQTLIYVRELEASGARSATPLLTRQVFTQAHFDEIIALIERRCEGISCPFRLVMCHDDYANIALQQWATREKASSVTLAALVRKISPVFRTYLTENRRYRAGTQARRDFTNKLYASMFPAETIAA